MSKYIKLEDAIAKMDEWFCEPYTPTQLLSVLPTIEVREDCISRQQAIDTVYKAYTRDDAMNEIYALPPVAPSVVPKPKEGEWIIEEKDSIYGKKIRLTCPECGDVFDVTEAAFPYERYCRYCGSKMKGAEE